MGTRCLQNTHVDGTPFCDNATHHSTESTYAMSTDQFLAE